MDKGTGQRTQHRELLLLWSPFTCCVVNISDAAVRRESDCYNSKPKREGMCRSCG